MPPPAFLASALRRLARSPRLSLAVVLCIAVGTAATTAALTLVSATLLRPLPYPEADRLVRVWLQEEGSEERLELSYPDVRDLERAVSSFDAFEAVARSRILFQGEGGARRVEGEAVTPGYFGLLGVEPLVGRLFSDREHRRGERVMLLDHRTWGSRFGYDEAAVGSTIRTDRGEYTVVGVLPQSFTGTVEEDSGDIELWVPIDEYVVPRRRARRDIGGIWTLARLAPGETLESAAGELAALSERFAELHPETHGDRDFLVEPVGESWRSEIRRGSLLLLAASVLLLLVAATNVAVLLLARAMNERREMAVRSALGAPRRRLLGAALLETVLLVAAGSLLGLGAGPPLLRALLTGGTLADESMLGIPVYVSLTFDPRAAALACLAFLVTALVAGLGPALLGSRVDPARALQEGGRTAAGTRGSRRWSAALVFAEVALTTVLVVGAALLVRSYHALQTEDLGFDPGGILRIALFVNEEDVPEVDGLVPFQERVRAALVAEPGVEAVGMVWPTVPIDWPVEGRLNASGFSPELQEEGIRTGVFFADPEYFGVVDVPVVAGRGFTAGDSASADAANVALVSRSLAERIAGSGDPERVLGAEAWIAGGPVRIVGVVGDVRYGGPREEPGAHHEVYLPFAREPQRLVSLLIETPGAPAALLPALSRRLADLAPASALDWVGPLDRWVTDLFVLDTRFLLSLVSLFSAAGLFLSAVGLFAVLADSVARRRGELGIRQALGATPGRILAAVVLQGLRVVALGLAAGAALAWASTRVLESTVHGVTPTDPWSFAAAALLLLGVALAAAALPARRAAAVDPAEALREE